MKAAESTDHVIFFLERQSKAYNKTTYIKEKKKRCGPWLEHDDQIGSKNPFDWDATRGSTCHDPKIDSWAVSVAHVLAP
jgi:hypothetical protein